MGYYVINNLIKERINNMSKETMRETINTITHLDSMKAVKVAFELSESIQDSVTKVMNIVSGNVSEFQNPGFKKSRIFFFLFFLGTL